MVHASSSLRRGLMLRMMLPAAALAAAMGLGGAVLIRDVVETTHDRLLDGSVLAIAERLAVDDDEVTVDLPRVALGMLESQAQDRIYYTVRYDEALITGYRDLPLPSVALPAIGVTRHWNAVMHGSAVRVAIQARHIYGKPNPVLVAVAETTDARRALELHLLSGLALLEVALLGLVGVLTWISIGNGLKPLIRLSTEIDRRAAPGGVDFQQLDLQGVPREALAPVRAFNALLERLEHSVGGIRRFTADASHQMRTPLATMRMHLGLVHRFGTWNPQAAAALDEVEGAAVRLEHLLAQLVLLARAEQDGEDALLPLGTVDLAEITAEVVAERVPLALQRKLDVQVDSPDEAVPVFGHRFLIGEIIANLMDNAIRYNRHGGNILVRVLLRSSDGYLEIEDEGPGIPEGERQLVFERFYRIPRLGGPDGSGLGLAIVRTLADRLGATVELGDGTAGRGLKAAVSFRAVSTELQSGLVV